MLVLRLVRTGRRNQPKFRLVAADQSEKLNGKVVEILGHYEPAAKEKPFVFDKEQVQGWLSKGGVPSNTVARLLNMNGFDLPVHQSAPAKPKKKAQARLDEANKPKEVTPVADATDSGEAPVAVEVPADGGEEVTAEDQPTQEAVPEVPVVEPAPSGDGSGEETPVVEEAVSEESTETNEEPASSSNEDVSGKA